MDKAKIYYLAPDCNRPIGGVKQLYRYIDILNRNGFSAYILHTKTGFRCTWFNNDTRIAYIRHLRGAGKPPAAVTVTIKYFLLSPVFNPFYIIRSIAKFFLRSAYRLEILEVSRRSLFNLIAGISGRKDAHLDKSDFLVIPENYGPKIAGYRIEMSYGPKIADIEQGVRKIIFNQNAHYTFKQYSFNKDESVTPYMDPEVIAVMVISEHSHDYLRYAFPKLNLTRLFIGIDPHLFKYNPVKKKQIAFMTRKLPDQIEEVINILKFRGALEGFELAPIVNKSEAETARVLQESLLFLSFSNKEGCPLPPMEAMACGCIVIGYDGYGGKEYFKEEFCYPVSCGDVLSFAKTVEAVIKEYAVNKDGILEKGKKASDFILKEYSLEKEEESVMSFWKEILRIYK